MDHDFREPVPLEVERAEFRVIHAEDFIFNLAKVARAFQRLTMNLGKVIGERPGHDDLAHVMHEPGNVVGFIRGRGDGGRHFPRENGAADGVLPEFAPGKRALGRELLKILDDRRHHRELPDLPHPKIKHGFLDAVDGTAQAVIDRVDQAEQARREAGVAPDDLGNLGGIPLFHREQLLQRLIDAVERGQGGTARELCLDFFQTQPGGCAGRQNLGHKKLIQ